MDAKGVYLLFFYLYNKNMTKLSYKEQKAKMSLCWLKTPESKIHNGGDRMIIGSRHRLMSRNLRAHILNQKHEQREKMVSDSRFFNLKACLQRHYFSSILPLAKLPKTVPPPRDWLFKCLRICGAFIIQATIGSKLPVPDWI